MLDCAFAPARSPAFAIISAASASTFASAAFASATSDVWYCVEARVSWATARASADACLANSAASTPSLAITGFEGVAGFTRLFTNGCTKGYDWKPCLSLATYRMMLFSSFLPSVMKKSPGSSSWGTPNTFSAALKAKVSRWAGNICLDAAKSRAVESVSCTAAHMQVDRCM